MITIEKSTRKHTSKAKTNQNRMFSDTINIATAIHHLQHIKCVLNPKVTYYGSSLLHYKNIFQEN